MSNAHNTLLVRLPNKNSNQQQSSKNQGQRPHYRPRPYQEQEDGKTDEQAQDLSVQETIHRPSINSVDDDVRILYCFGDEGFLWC